MLRCYSSVVLAQGRFALAFPHTDLTSSPGGELWMMAGCWADRRPQRDAQRTREGVMYAGPNESEGQWCEFGWGLTWPWHLVVSPREALCTLLRVGETAKTRERERVLEVHEEKSL